MKITETKILEDDQKIYVMGLTSPKKFWDAATATSKSSSLNIYNFSETHKIHYAIIRLIQQNHAELSKWLKFNKAKVTGWIDPDIVHIIPSLTWNTSRWGIGFKPGDPLETVVVLKWSC